MLSFPCRQFKLFSHLGAADVLARLETETEAPRWMHWSRRHRLLQGKINGSRFVVQRIIHERNSFLPLMTGEVVSTDDGTIIAGIMRLAP
jgi:hypothetical protein